LYCPYCGANNDRGEGKCFVCEKSLPNLRDAASAAAAGSARAATRVVERRDASGGPLVGAVGDRVIALLFDRIVIAAILMVVSAWATSAHYQPPTSTSGALSVGGAVILITFLYHFLCESIFLTTVGKAAMGLHVGIEDDKNRFAAVAIRNALRIVDAIGFYLIGFLFATFTLKRQRVGDLVGHTVVVDWPVARGARAAVMFLIIVIIAAAVWISTMICPECGSSVSHMIPSVS
jgi:uncharacterized RDD family membrane protein YckC